MKKSKTRDLLSVASSARGSANLRSRVGSVWIWKVTFLFSKVGSCKLIFVFRFCILDPGGKIRTRRDLASVASSARRSLMVSSVLSSTVALTVFCLVFRNGFLWCFVTVA